MSPMWKLLAALVGFVVSVKAFISPQPSLTNRRVLSPFFVATDETVLQVDGAVATLDESTDEIGVEVTIDELQAAVEAEAEILVQELVDETCEADDEGQPVDEICVDEEEKKGFRSSLKSVIGKTLRLLRSSENEPDGEEEPVVS